MLNKSLIVGARRAVLAGGIIAMMGAAPALAEALKLAHWVPPQHTLTASTIEPLAAGVAADTNGALTIDVYPGGELGAGPLEQYVRVVQGVADIVWGLQGYTSSQFPRTMLSELPGALPEGMTGYDMIWNAYEAGQLSGEFPATRPLALWLSEPNVFIMKDHEIRTPEDVRGLKIRVSGSAAAATMEALGATPVQMPAGEIYNALQTGLIDGVITGSSAIGDFRLDEVANSYTFGAPLGRISFYLVMNEAKYQSLPADQQAAIDANSGRGLSKLAEDGWNARAIDVINAITTAGDNTIIELTDDEAAAFGEFTLPVAAGVIGQIAGGQEVYDTMRGGM
jgi:TRAP-type C4-dicarboxylate transport system substrate-binding protein